MVHGLSDHDAQSTTCCGVFVWGYGIGFVRRICIPIKMISLILSARVASYGTGLPRITGGLAYTVRI